MQMPRWQCCQLCCLGSKHLLCCSPHTCCPVPDRHAGAGLPWGPQARSSRASATAAPPSSHSCSDQLPLLDMRSVPTSALSVTTSVLNCVNCNSAQAIQSCSGPALRAGQPSEELAGPRPREAAGCRQGVPPLLLLLLAAAQPVGCCPRRRCAVGRRVTLPLLLPGVELGKPLHTCGRRRGDRPCSVSVLIILGNKDSFAPAAVHINHCWNCAHPGGTTTGHWSSALCTHLHA